MGIFLSYPLVWWGASSRCVFWSEAVWQLGWSPPVAHSDFSPTWRREKHQETVKKQCNLFLFTCSFALIANCPSENRLILVHLPSCVTCWQAAYSPASLGILALQLNDVPGFDGDAVRMVLKTVRQSHIPARSLKVKSMTMTIQSVSNKNIRSFL